MADPITFYFDFSSPYGYLGSERIEAVAAGLGREVAWKPVLLGATFKATGMRPLTEIPIKGDYARHDLLRSARKVGIACRIPSRFPFASISACRAFYWVEEAYPAKATDLVHSLFRAAWQHDQDISAPEGVIAVAEGIGLDAAEVKAALQSPTIKQRLRDEVDASLAAGVCGAPFMIVDGEPFWGHDRLEDMADWVRSGGW